MLFVATTFKLLAEIALFAMAGQWILGLLAGQRKSANPVYRVLHLVGHPWRCAARCLLPRAVPDRHLPVAAVVLVASVWLVATVGKVTVCLNIGVGLCR
jgi:hypothetical protein